MLTLPAEISGLVCAHRHAHRSAHRHPRTRGTGCQVHLTFRWTVTVVQGRVSLWCGDTGIRQHLKPPPWLPSSRHSLGRQSRLRGSWPTIQPTTEHRGCQVAFSKDDKSKRLRGTFRTYRRLIAQVQKCSMRLSLSTRVDSWLNAGISSPWDCGKQTQETPRCPVSPEAPSSPAAGTHAEPLSTEWRPETDILLKPLISL